jgi:hypothetical protein
MTNHEQSDYRQACDVVNALKNKALNEPTQKHINDLVVAVKHYNKLGYGFKLTRETTQCRKLNASQTTQY